MAGDFTNELVSVVENTNKFTCSLTVLSSLIQFPYQCTLVHYNHRKGQFSLGFALEMT